MLRSALGLALLASSATVMPTSPALAASPAPAHRQLVELFAEWRAFNQPAIVRGVPDYSAAAMAARRPTEAALRLTPVWRLTR